MRIKVIPEDFIVEEVLTARLAQGGRYAVYRARKRAITTLQLQHRLAAALNRPHSAVAFPALKDKQAVAVQFGTVRGPGPLRVVGHGFTAERVGWLSQPLSPNGVAGNRFTVTLRDLGEGEVTHTTARLAEIARWGLPNYFDEQRFGSRLADGTFPGQLILQRDEAGALRAHLAGQQAGDRPKVRAFKTFAAEQWGDWAAIFERAPKPSNYRSVLTYLRDHPSGYRRALNLVTPRVLSLYLAAYQSFLWNRLAERFLRRRLEVEDVSMVTIDVAGEALPVYRQLPEETLASLQDLSLPLLHHRLNPDDPAVAALIEETLQQEGFQTRDLKARVLKKAYLAKGSRALLVLPQDLAWEPVEADDRFPGQYKLTVRFFLPRGSYATLLLKVVAGA
jgi:tRNA pseudouridine13 synthase